VTEFIYGRAGSGKTTEICKKATASLDAGRNVFLIVPEQMAVDTEERMTALLGNRPSLNLEILNFRRLTNRVFREFGGLSYNYITKSGKKLMMWQTITELSGLLNTPIQTDRGGVDAMLSAITEFKAYGVMPHMLENAAKMPEIGDSTELSNKLYDLSLIYAAFTRLVAQTMDDAADDLTKAAELLRENSMFSGADVYFDSFLGFTPQELSVIREIFRSADNVTLSLCLDNVPCRSSDELFVNLKATAEKLREIAEACGCDITERLLTECRRSDRPELKFLEKHLWSLDVTGKDGYKKPAPSISFFECPGLFAECEAMAADICKKVRSGASWRDFSVITRGTERYDGIIDVIFEKYGIPLYVSRKTDIQNKPLIKMILAALALKKNNFRTADLISYIKTGLLGLTPDEVSELENYAERWNIRGAVRWASEWEMNPDGYTAEFNEDTALRLANINELRERVMLPLADLHAAIDSSDTVRDFAAALYSYLLNLNIPEKLSEEAAKKRVTSPAEAQETEQIFSILIDALDELCTVMPELSVNSEVFAELLRIIFDETDIGSIPCSVDEVTFGDAALARLSGKHIYVIGANETIFPKAPENRSLFSDSDREKLMRAGIELAPGTEYNSADERFAFWRALTSASSSVTVIWSRSDLSGHAMKPSLGVKRLCALFPEVKLQSFEDIDAADMLWGKNNLPELAAKTDGTPLGNAIREYMSADTVLKQKLQKLDVPLTYDNEVLSKETAEMISGGDLALTQSRLDTFVLCHFSYFCKHILKLDEKKQASFDAADIGTFVHHILEVFVKEAEERGGLSSLTDADIDLMVETIITDYMTAICRIAPDFSGSRLANLFSRLRRSSRLLCKNLAKEFSQCRFRPAFFELDIKFPTDEKPAVEPLTVSLEDGSRAYIYGVADRVDIMEHGDSLYVRVIDYKTGSKDFSKKDIDMGLGLQMLLYLFSIWKNGSKHKGALEFAKNAEIIPAGVLYFKAGISTVTLDSELSPEAVEEVVSDGLTRKGLLLDDLEVLKAMDKDLSGKYVQVKLKKDGTPSKSDSLTSLEDFQRMLGDIENTIRRIGGEIKGGNASANPICDKKHDACKYCAMKPICRKSNVKGGF